jgi:hypothetical protein
MRTFCLNCEFSANNYVESQYLRFKAALSLGQNTHAFIALDKTSVSAMSKFVSNEFRDKVEKSKLEFLEQTNRLLFCSVQRYNLSCTKELTPVLICL